MRISLEDLCGEAISKLVRDQNSGLTGLQLPPGRPYSALDKADMSVIIASLKENPI